MCKLNVFRVIKIPTIPQNLKQSFNHSCHYICFLYKLHNRTPCHPGTAGNWQPTVPSNGAFGEPMLSELWKWHPTQTPKGASIILTQKDFCSQHMALKLVSRETSFMYCVQIFKHLPLQRSLIGIFCECRGKWMVNWHLLFPPWL